MTVYLGCILFGTFSMCGQVHRSLVSAAIKCAHRLENSRYVSSIKM